MCGWEAYEWIAFPKIECGIYSHLATDLEMLSYHLLIEVHPDDGYEFCCLLTHVCSLYFLEGECPIWWVLFWWRPSLELCLVFPSQV